MNKIVYKYNRFLIAIFVFAPFIAYIFISYLHVSFNRTMQVLSYIGVVLILLIREKKYPIKFPKYLFFYLLFILYVFYSTFILLNREFKIVYLFSNYMIGAFNFMFIIENIKVSKRDYTFIIKYSKYILIIAMFVIVYQQVFNPHFFVNTKIFDELIEISDNKNRLPSIYSWLNSNTLGFSFIPIFILIVEYLDKKGKNIFLWIVLGILVTFLSKARWVMLNVLLVFAILFINHKDKTIIFLKYIFIFPIVIFISFLIFGSVGVDLKGIVNERILESNKKDITQKSAGTRILALNAFNQLYLENPLFGVGNIKYGMGGTGKQDYKLRSILKGRSSQIHVGYLSLFYMYGMIGGFFFLNFLYLLLKKLYQNAKITGVWAPFLGFLGFALANLTLVVFSVFEMGLIIVLVADKYYSQQISLKKNKFA